MSRRTGTRRRSLWAYTLLEIMLVLALGAVLAAATLPAFSGWWTEHRLRSVAGGLIETVQASKLDADETGRCQTIVLAAPGQQIASPLPPDTRVFREEGSVRWSIRSFWGKDGGASLEKMQVDAHGLVDPVFFRVDEGKRFVEYRFDVLTGHAVEEASSF